MIYLLAKPNHFRVSYKINPYMEPDKFYETDRENAQKEHNLLSYIFRGNSIEVSDFPACPDSVFTANFAVVHKGKALLSNFKHPERRIEQSYIRSFFEDLVWNGYFSWKEPYGSFNAFKVFPNNEVFFEGAGDCIWDKKRKLFWMGYGQRTSLESQRIVADVFDVTVIPLELVDSYFYHLDLALHVLYNGKVMYYPGAFSLDSLYLLELLVAPKDRILLSYEDAKAFAANSISMNNKIIVPAGCSDDLITKLWNNSGSVVSVNLPSFQKAGGSAACLTLDLDNGKD